MFEIHWLRPVSNKNMNDIEAALVKKEKHILAAAEKVKELNPILGDAWFLMISLVEPKWEAEDSPGFKCISILDRDRFMEETWRKLMRDDSWLRDFLKPQLLSVSYSAETGLYGFHVIQGIYPMEPEPVALVEFSGLKCYTREMWDEAEREGERTLR